MINEKHLPFSNKPRLTPELVVKMLKEKGNKVTISEAEEILKFMRKMAKIAVGNNLDQHYNDADEKINDTV